MRWAPEKGSSMGSSMGRGRREGEREGVEGVIGKGGRDLDPGQRIGVKVERGIKGIGAGMGRGGVKV